MPELEELKRRLCSLQKAAVYSKAAAAEEALECAVRVLVAMAARIDELEARDLAISEAIDKGEN